MDNYWEDRYAAGGNSGAGSYGEYAEHKADIINEYIDKFDIETISDFGCGDGNQIWMLKGFDDYYGYDISAYALHLCNEKFKHDDRYHFCSLMTDLPKADLCLSLDVLYHIIPTVDWGTYLTYLFEKSKKYVLIFSSNHDRNDPNVTHIFHRKFTDWIEENYKNFELVEETENFLQTSAKFYLYMRKENI